MRKHAARARIAEDVDGADLSGVSGTPTFFVNGRRHYGAYDIETLAERRAGRPRPRGAEAGSPPSESLQNPCGRNAVEPRRPRRIPHDVDVTLIAVAAVAGLATFLSPCVLPVLPVVAAASTTGGRRRPLGIAAGLAVAFVVFTLLASRVLSALGLPQDLLRNIAIALLAVAGVAPARARRSGSWLGRAFQPLAARAGGRLAGGRRVLVGRRRWGPGSRSCGRPCAGPILAAVSALSAERRISLELVLITIAYAAGATLPLFALALLGHRAAG